MEKSSMSAGSKVPKKAFSMFDQGNTMSDQNQVESTFDKELENNLSPKGTVTETTEK